MGTPFYDMALIRNYISTLINGNKNPPPENLKDKICQLDDKTLREIIDDTAEYILNVKMDDRRRDEILKFIKDICVQS
ncbi:MAG: hypothetical protein JZD40_05905 [Sulfolobus sp.]|nr:hypothetical protein [Sulfolobus sp.]MBP1358002.1 hypothetical protein [Sulfolobus sp.]